MGRCRWSNDGSLNAADGDSPLRVSDISLWEIATLHSLGRVQFTIPLREWLEKAVAPPLVRRHGIYARRSRAERGRPA